MKQKTNIVHHNIRMNLNNEQHRRVHKVLTELNMNVHKSVNQFLIDAADAYIGRLNKSDFVTGDNQGQERCNVITQVDLENLRKEIKEELLKEIVILLGGAFAVGRGFQISDMKVDKQKDDIKKEEQELIDETTIGLASSWG